MAASAVAAAAALSRQASRSALNSRPCCYRLLQHVGPATRISSSDCASSAASFGGGRALVTSCWPAHSSRQLNARHSASAASTVATATVPPLPALQQLRAAAAAQQRGLSTNSGGGKREPDDDVDKPDWQFEQPPMERPQPPPPNFIDGPTEQVMDICDRICALNILDLVQLMKLYQKRTGITDSMIEARMSGGGGGQLGAGGAAGGAAAAAEPAVEKTVFDLKLVSYDAKSKIKVIKEVRTITGLGLKEAKELVEGVPKLLKKEMAKPDAEKLVAKLKEVGAECTMD